MKNLARVPWALVISSFINKSGEMAMSLLPMLLIERQLSATESSLILGAAKGARTIGLLAGGLLSDAVGFRVVILASYLTGFLGFTVLPYLASPILIGVFSMIAQFGSSLFPASARALVREMKEIELKKSMAWLRTASNLGQVVSSLVSIAFGSLGLLIPFLFDGMTSLAAFSIGLFTLRDPQSKEQESGEATVETGYYLYSLALACFYFVYELGFLSFSGFGKLALGDGGIRAFGVVLLVNTLLCGVLAVPAAHFFHRPSRSLGLGFALVTLGMMMVTVLPKTILCFVICSLIMTIGEIIFSVHAQTLLMTNSRGKTNRHYGFSLLIQSSGRLAAGVVLFPLVLTAAYPSLPFVVAFGVFFLLMAKLPREFLLRV